MLMGTLWGSFRDIDSFVSYSAKAFAWGVCPARCSDSCADFAKRRNGFKRSLEAYKRKVYGQSHTGSQQKFDQSAKFGRAGSPAAVYPCAWVSSCSHIPERPWGVGTNPSSTHIPIAAAPAWVSWVRRRGNRDVRAAHGGAASFTHDK